MPAEHASSVPFLRETLLFLALAGILIPLLQKLRINQVLGFLAVGMLVGPHGLGTWADRWPWLEYLTFPGFQGVKSLAELGVIFMMFLIGLELSVERMWALRRWVFGAGVAQVALSAAAIGALAHHFGNSLEASILLGLVLSLSSTAVATQLLTQQRGIATPMGQAVFAVLMLQDFAVVPILILIELPMQEAPANVARTMAWSLLKCAVAVVLIYWAGRQVVRPVFRRLAARHQPEVFMALTLLVTLGIAGATEQAGLSMALGAFLAGLLFAETEYRHEVNVTIEPFKALLMGLFFMSVGMGIDVREVARHPVWLPVSVGGLLVLKAAIAIAVFRTGRMPWGRAVEGGLLLSQGSEFAFIILGYAASAGRLTPAGAQFILLVVSLSLMVTPLVARVGRWLGERAEASDAGAGQAAAASMPRDLSGHVVIAGFGRVGRLLGEVLESQSVPYVAVEHDARIVSGACDRERSVCYGDASKPELLRKLNIASAAALLVTMDHPAAAMHAVRSARAESPNLPIFARSRDERHAFELRKAGATAVVPETLEVALELCSFALQALGTPEAQAGDVVEAERERRVSRG